MSEFGERAKAFWARLVGRDQKTHLTVASVAAVIVVLLAIIALPISDEDSGPVAGDTSTRAAELAEQPLDVLGGATADDGRATGSDDAPVEESRSTADVGIPDVPKDAPPITATTVKVGIPYTSDAGSTNEAAGFGAIGQVNQKRGWDAVIREYNKNPPAGRKIAPVYFPVTEQEIASKGSERLQQEACAHFTQDNRVFMVWEWSVGGEILDACLTKAGIAMIGAGSAGDSSEFKKNPYKVNPTAAAMDRMAAFEVDQLYAGGFFKDFKENALPYTPQVPADKKPRIGLIRYNEPAYKVSAQAMKDRLKAHGLSLCAGCEFEVSYSSDNPQEQLDDATEVNSAIQNFKSKGVTHVLFLGTTAGVRITLFYIDGAEKQQYRAKLGFNPNDAPYAVRDFLKEPSYPQFRDSLFVSDTPYGFNVRTAAFAKCKKIFMDAGETFNGDEAANKEAQIPSYCDDASYTRSVMESVGEKLNLDSWMNAVHTMKPVPSASVYLMQTKLGRPDGSGAVRVGPWFDDCACWKPTTGIIPV